MQHDRRWLPEATGFHNSTSSCNSDFRLASVIAGSMLAAAAARIQHAQ